MRNWNLIPGDPYTLNLAADQRFTQIDYTNDHIWEILLGTDDPASVLLKTSYGLRAKNMRLFPRFVEGDKAISNPSDFNSPPTIHKFFPNYVTLSFSPFTGIDVQMDYWVTDNQTVAGRIHVTNAGVTSRNLRLELVALLHPSGENPQTMNPTKMEITTVLQGRTENLSPVLFITGGATGFTSPFPALVHELSLVPNESRRFTWVLATFPDPEKSFEHTRNIATKNWEAEAAKIEMTNANQIEIKTGDIDWDAAFAFGQRQSYLHLISPTNHLPYSSIVSTREPDQGFSPRGDGSDYNHLWNGQTAIEAYYLIRLLLPGDIKTAKGIMMNFLSIQDEDGSIDWKPGLAGQRGNMLATPILVSMAWEIYQYSEDIEFLKEIFPKLLDFTQHWFTDNHDRDGDGIPEWSNSLQTGFDDNPTFARWHTWSQAVDITLVESPDLCAFLYRECQLLLQISTLIDRIEPQAALEALSQNLEVAINASYDGRSKTYRYWDRETHQSPKGELLKFRKGSGEMFLDMVFELPARLLLRMETNIDVQPQAQATIHGSLENGQHLVIRLKKPALLWTQGIGTATLDNLYSDLEHIQIEGLTEDGKASIQIVDLKREDHTLLLPLWANIPNPETAKKIIKQKISNPNQYYKPYGIPACPKPPKHPDAEICNSTWLPWNEMIGKGLLEYGAVDETVDLVTRIMNSIIENLKRENGFRKHYHSSEQKSLGEKNALTGLPPIGLFLDSLGLKIISSQKIIIQFSNPYPWPVKLQYRGLVIDHKADETIINFPNGQIIHIDQNQIPCQIIEKSLIKEE